MLILIKRRQFPVVLPYDSIVSDGRQQWPSIQFFAFICTASAWISLHITGWMQELQEGTAVTAEPTALAQDSMQR